MIINYNRKTFIVQEKVKYWWQQKLLKRWLSLFLGRNFPFNFNQCREKTFDVHKKSGKFEL